MVTTYTSKVMAKMKAAADLAAKFTFRLAAPSVFVVADALVLEEVGGACTGEPVKGLLLLKKGASSHGLAAEEGASEAEAAPNGDGDGA